MAILWTKTIDDTVYEVRSAGRTRRLYRDGVLHSAYNPLKPVNNGIWDLLFLPVLFKGPGEVQNILVLGVGGGVVIHLLNEFIRPKKIIGIEIDKIHIDVARKYFALKSDNLKLIRADAIEWVNAYRGPVFDLIIEDVFIEDDKEPMRLMHGDRQWLSTLRNLLSEKGTLVLNHATDREARFTKDYAGKYAACFQFSLPLLENKVLALLKEATSTAALNTRIENTDELHRLKSQNQLSYSCRRIY